jgi:5-methylcytosine-specific restriction protein A
MSRHNLYDHRWRKARAAFLAEHPLCRYCEEAGKLAPATVVDHVIPHKGNEELFWNVDNWAPLCATHHNASKQREERRGHAIGCDVHGNPHSGWKA